MNCHPARAWASATAVIEVTAIPHRGCAKFTRRFGLDAMRFVNSEAGTRLNLRGINAKVVVPGTIRTGDSIVTVHEPASADGRRLTARPRSRAIAQISRRSLAHAVSWWRLDSCSLRSTAETCVSIVFTERCRRPAISLYV